MGINKNTMKRLTLIFLLIANLAIGQNRDSYLATGMRDGLVEHFDSLGVIILPDASECDCGIESTSYVTFTLDRSDNHLHTGIGLDDAMLNDYPAYELPEELIVTEKVYLKRWSVVFTNVHIDVDIKRNWIRFNPFIMKYQVKYTIIVTYTYNP